MKYIQVEASTVYRGKLGSTAPAIYVVDFPEHPFDIADIAATLDSTVITVPIADWNASLTPWPAAGLYREEPDFGGDARHTLSELLEQALPHIEQEHGLAPCKRAICGYSLGGLFSLYAFTHAATFDACACISGSVWYEGWVDHLRQLDFDAVGRYAFLSIGTKEKRGAPKIIRTVQDNMEACAEILRAHGCETTYVTGPGNHMQLHHERFATGLAHLDAYLKR